jgi:pimeloyl-ACP methyl ester carboxylesterase
VLALDLVGFGESARPAARATASDYVRTLAEFVRALDWEQPPIIVASGLSAGLSACFAAQHPELVSRLILHMPNGSGDLGEYALSVASRLLYRAPLLARFLYRNHLATKSSMLHWLRKVVFLDPALVTEEVAEVFTTCAQQPSAEYAALSWLSGGLSFDLEACWPRLPQPVALLWGEERTPESEARAFRLQRLLPASTVTVISGAGVMAALEAPAAMIAALHEQLRSDLRVLKAG